LAVFSVWFYEVFAPEWLLGGLRVWDGLFLGFYFIWGPVFSGGVVVG
jgi:hypothetical protein